jgi:hypothetical protein
LRGSDDAKYFCRTIHINAGTRSLIRKTSCTFPESLCLGKKYEELSVEKFEAAKHFRAALAERIF